MKSKKRRFLQLRNKLRDRQWNWTAADRAEYEALVWQLIIEYRKHRPLCGTCSLGDIYSCSEFGEAVQAIQDWVFGRRLLTRAEALRPPPKP